jgi:hypothetical protein
MAEMRMIMMLIQLQLIVMMSGGVERLQRSEQGGVETDTLPPGPWWRW